MKSILLYSKNISEAKNEIEKLGGKLNQQFTENLFGAELPNAVNIMALEYSSFNIPSTLDEASQIVYDAWKRYQGKNNLKVLAPDYRDGLPWDAEGFMPPRDMNKLNSSTVTGGQKIILSTGTPTSLYMIGSVAVGIIIVSGKGDLAFTDNEVRQVISEVQEGLDFLARAEPRAKVSFIYDIHNIQIGAGPGNTNDFETAESPWRNEALGKMGFTPSRQGSVEYVNRLKQDKQTNWAYVTYFTKYPLCHFAYAVEEKVVMNYFNDEWGPENINCVFAHETCHIFGAADEYGFCNCNSEHGHLSVKNGNCRSCATSFEKCLMEQNDLLMCDYTRRQIGWAPPLLP